MTEPTSTPALTLKIPHTLAEILRQHAQAGLPNEVCGLLAGNSREVLTVLPVPNALTSPSRYRMDPEEQLKAFKHIEDLGLELLAIYHSHPKGPLHPSLEDIAAHYYPGVSTVILAPGGTGWEIGAFNLIMEGYEPIDMVITSPS